jgi:protein TonB
MNNMTNLRALIVATIAFSGAAMANEVPASFDAKTCRADYPKASLMNEEQGITTMQFLVSADGRVLDSKLDKTSGFKALDRAALSALSACKFKPGSKDGKPDQTWTKVEYKWSLS